MKYIPISELDETTSASDTDLIAIDNGSKTSKITVANYNSNANATAKSYAEASATSASEAATSVENATKQAESAQASASAASESATAASASKDSASEYATNAAAQADNAKSYASEASTSANNASTSATNANDYAITSKSWAVGGTSTRDGEDTNNAKYWSQVAAGAAAGGVVTFNGRNGAVTPQSGDYSAAMITRGSSDVSTDLANLETNLSAETTRAEEAESANASAISANASAIANESTRAKAAEANLSSELNDQIYSINTGIYIRVKTGKNLGNGLTSQQAKKISDGDFYGLNIGDYWEANGNKFRIWHPNWYMNRGDQKFTENHLVIMPDANILKADGSTTHYMNNTDTTSGGYAGTKYRSTYKSQCLKAFTDVFGTDHIAKYRGLLSNAVASGMASGWAWYDCDAELPSEEMMFGAHHWSTSTDSGSSGYNGGSFWGQLALAIIAPEFVVNGENYFEQDVATAAWFALVYDLGRAGGGRASSPWVGVRPFALLI